MSLVALLLMWFATVAQEPGGFSTVAAEVEFAEQQVGDRLSELERPVVLDEHDSSTSVYMNGVMCERDEETGEVTHCRSLMAPEMFGY